MEDQKTRAALEEHWSGAPAEDLETAFDKADLIYHDVVEYRQSGERILLLELGSFLVSRPS